MSAGQFENGHTILCLNSGSSSLKFALYRIANNEEKRVADGEVERIGLKNGILWVRNAEKKVVSEIKSEFPDSKTAVRYAFDTIKQLNFQMPVAVGHRVVHGGPDYTKPVIINRQVIGSLHEMIPYAPLHLPGEIHCIKAVAEHFPGLPQVACFDTAFHRSMPELAQRFPLPASLWHEGLRRYGFHGLSYEYIIDALGKADQGRIVIAHLGNGASMAAVRNGQPLDTTMGFTPAGGLMMGTRSGDLDPGILFYLIRDKGYNPEQIEDLVNHRSGLLGVSGISPDMKTLLEKMDGEPAARLAVEMFCYSIRKYIGALTAVLCGLDTLVFTGGIGEHASEVRQMVCNGLEYLGIFIDKKKNENHAETITTSHSSCRVRIIPTNEDLVIARHTIRLISPEKK